MAHVSAAFAAAQSERDFSHKTIRGLARKGMRLVDSFLLADENGSYASGLVGYVVDDEGLGRVLTFGQVVALAGE